jgi:hypothetical protein
MKDLLTFLIPHFSFLICNISNLSLSHFRKGVTAMMKKYVCIWLLVCAGMGTAFAQQEPADGATPAETAPAAPKERKNSLGLDLFQLFNGFIASDSDSDFTVFIVSAGYERLIVPHFSLGADLDLYFLKLGSRDGAYFSLAAEGRYYPMSENFEKFFLGTTLGFNVLSLDGSTKPEKGGFSGLIVSLKAGYKLITAKNIYLEPSLGYVLSKSSMASMFGVPTPLGWNGGLRFGFVF